MEKTLSLKNPPKIEAPEKTETERRKEALAFLCEALPKCFSTENPKPLKIGILEDVAAELGKEAPYSKTRLRRAIQFYCGSNKYLKATANGGHRVDLDGKKAGEITQAQQDYATKAQESRKRKK